MKILVRTAAILASLLAGPSLAADDAAYDRFFLRPDVSTLGAGIEGGYRMSESWRMRAGINGFAARFVYRDRDSDLHSRLTLLSGGATVDYFPFAGDVYLSAGLRLSANRIEGSVKNLHGRLRTGSPVFVADPLTDFTVRQNVVQPYLGAGYSRRIGDRVSLTLDFGALYAGTPDLDVTSRADTLGFSKKQVRDQIERARSRIAPFTLYPVVQAGFTFRF
ncbi:MAG: hypothetical protein KDJ87_18755 [Rhizobiaceae bacterium]|nr:hypothetical protein [Rhizobiaceae bacterium]